jgi:hypothetical protein
MSFDITPEMRLMAIGPRPDLPPEVPPAPPEIPPDGPPDAPGDVPVEDPPPLVPPDAPPEAPPEPPVKEPPDAPRQQLLPEPSAATHPLASRVIAGRDPAIQSLVDARVEPAHDHCETSVPVAAPGVRGACLISGSPAR